MHRFWQLAGICLLLVSIAFADKKSKPDEGITKEQADAILNELKQIRVLLEKNQRAVVAPQAPEPMKASLKIEGGPVLGSKDAPVTMVEFTDYQCTFCRQFHLATFPALRQKYIDTGKVRFVTRDLPLDIHANAFPAAEAARCAGEQGQFWKMRDVMITNANALGPEKLVEYAQAIPLDIPKFRACVDSHKYQDSVRKDFAEATSLRIEGTPTFLIGKTTPQGVDGTIVVGAQPLAAFEARLRELDPAMK
jgi:protein-disulfide isomerase